jgi:hypothetical protein
MSCEGEDEPTDSKGDGAEDEGGASAPSVHQQSTEEGPSRTCNRLHAGCNHMSTLLLLVTRLLNGSCLYKLCPTE